MPPRAVPKRVRDFILYYYAKLVIAPSAGEKGNYRFVMDRFKRLTSGEISMSDYDREIQKLVWASKTRSTRVAGALAPRATWG